MNLFFARCIGNCAARICGPGSRQGTRLKACGETRISGPVRTRDISLRPAKTNGRMRNFLPPASKRWPITFLRIWRTSARGDPLTACECWRSAAWECAERPGMKTRSRTATPGSPTRSSETMSARPTASWYREDCSSSRFAATPPTSPPQTTHGSACRFRMTRPWNWREHAVSTRDTG